MLLLTLLFSVVLAVAARPTSFVLIGDSTTNNNTVPNSGGWGNGFCASLVEGTPCINTAHDGATTGSFVAQGLFNISLAAIKNEVANGRRTLVTIQFGHNDMKIAPPESMGANLTAMIQQIRAINGEPVLITSLTRRNFNADGTINDTLGPWANETILIAHEQHTHLLDLHAASIKYVEEIGPEAAHRLNRTPDDTTHLNPNGTIVFGRLVADLMAKSFPGQLPIVPNPPLTYNITHGISSF
ncbi:SGNH hydrolase [Panus rudis PR-1116 ss-1]|nr:SGNH hydrolase [Panus rudis PR-1116 ss-1]